MEIARETTAKQVEIVLYSVAVLLIGIKIGDRLGQMAEHHCGFESRSDHAKIQQRRDALQIIDPLRHVGATRRRWGCNSPHHFKHKSRHYLSALNLI